MGKLTVPANVTSITINGVVLVPDAARLVTVTSAQATGITPQQFQPKLLSTDLLGNATVQLPENITSISFAGVAYAGDGQNKIVLPPLLASLFLGAESWHPFWYHDPESGLPPSELPIEFKPEDPILPQTPTVDVPFFKDISGHFRNGAPPIIYELFSGGLPPGLALNPGNGHITGTPTTPGNSGDVVFKATDGRGNSANSNGVNFTTSIPTVALEDRKSVV